MTELSPVVSSLAPRAPARGSLRELVQLGTPVVLTQLSSTLMGVVDSAFVGRLGAAELGAVAFASIWSWTLFSLFFGSASSVQTFVAQAHGAGEAKRCGLWAWQGLWAIAPLTALAAAACWYAAPHALPHLGGSPELVAPAIAYLQPRAVGMAALSVVFVWGAFFRGIGDMRTPLIAGVVANLANVVGDYALIFGQLGCPRLGVAGAAVATSASEWLYAAILVAAASRRAVVDAHATAPILPDRVALRRLLRTGLPIGGQWVFDSAAFAAFTYLVTYMGAASVAASHAFIMLINISFMIALGVSSATQTLVGRYIGAREPELAVRALKNGLGLALALSSALALGLLAAPETLMRIFSDDPRVLALGTPLLRMGALFQLLDAAHIVATGALRGAGDTRWPFVLQSVLAWGVFLPVAWLFGVRLGFGLLGAWVGGLAYVTLLAGGLLWRLRSGKWRDVEI